MPPRVDTRRRAAAGVPLCLLACFSTCSLLLASFVSVAAQDVEVPVPTFEAFHPKGLRVSIPDIDGLEIFAFHGNVNRPLNNVEAGEMSVDVTAKKGGRWEYFNENRRLKVGDVINYWVWIQVERKGYQRLGLSHLVTELLPLEVKPALRPAVTFSLGGLLGTLQQGLGQGQQGASRPPQESRPTQQEQYRPRPPRPSESRPPNPFDSRPSVEGSWSQGGASEHRPTPGEQGPDRPSPGEYRPPGDHRPPYGEYRPPQNENRPPPDEYRPPSGGNRPLPDENRPPPGGNRPVPDEYRPQGGEYSEYRPPSSHFGARPPPPPTHNHEYPPPPPVVTVVHVQHNHHVGFATGEDNYGQGQERPTGSNSNGYPEDRPTHQERPNGYPEDRPTHQERPNGYPEDRPTHQERPTDLDPDDRPDDHEQPTLAAVNPTPAGWWQGGSEAGQGGQGGSQGGDVVPVGVGLPLTPVDRVSVRPPAGRPGTLALRTVGDARQRQARLQGGGGLRREVELPGSAEVVARGQDIWQPGLRVLHLRAAPREHVR